MLFSLLANIDFENKENIHNNNSNILNIEFKKRKNIGLITL